MANYDGKIAVPPGPDGPTPSMWSGSALAPVAFLWVVLAMASVPVLFRRLRTPRHRVARFGLATLAALVIGPPFLLYRGLAALIARRPVRRVA